MSDSITYDGKNGAAVRRWVNADAGVDAERETWFMTRGMSNPTGNQAWRYAKGDDEWPEGTRAAVYDPRTGRWLPVAVGDAIVRQGSGYGVEAAS